jgi:hypothetical protein
MTTNVVEATQAITLILILLLELVNPTYWAVSAFGCLVERVRGDRIYASQDLLLYLYCITIMAGLSSTSPCVARAVQAVPFFVAPWHRLLPAFDGSSCGVGTSVVADKLDQASDFRHTSPLPTPHIDRLIAGDIAGWFEERNRSAQLGNSRAV